MTSFKITISDEKLLVVTIFLCSFMLVITLDSGWAIAISILMLVRTMYPFLKLFHEKKDDPNEEAS